MSESIDRERLHREQDAAIAKLVAESNKLLAETAQISAANRAYPWLPLAVALVGGTVLPAIIGAAVALLATHH